MASETLAIPEDYLVEFLDFLEYSMKNYNKPLSKPLKNGLEYWIEEERAYTEDWEESAPRHNYSIIKERHWKQHHIVTIEKVYYGVDLQPLCFKPKLVSISTKEKWEGSTADELLELINKKRKEGVTNPVCESCLDLLENQR